MTQPRDNFEDRFSRQASAYARHRPLYPSELFEFLASIAPERGVAWDCGTGSGQAAISLSRHFSRVIATDPSAEQIAHAQRFDGVEYAVAPAERSPLADHSVALVAAASALHWFDLGAFYAESRRVLIPRGILAAWGYRESVIEPAIDALVNRYQNESLAPFWSARIRLVAGGYGDIPFPFEEIAAPEFSARAAWTSEDMLAYLATWSASQAYLEARGSAPTELIRAELAALWGPGTRQVRWPLFMRVGRV